METVKAKVEKKKSVRGLQVSNCVRTKGYFLYFWFFIYNINVN